MNDISQPFERIARLICLIFFAIVACHASASNIAWNSIQLEEYYGDGRYSIRYPYITMQASVVNRTLVLWAEAYEYMEFASSWALANNGDLVSVEGMQKKSSYFYSADFNVSEEPGVVHTDYSINIKEGESVYLAIISRMYTTPEDYEVGWVELYYGSDGVLSSKASALDYDGRNLVVGSIPEPTAAMLLLLGVAGLALRRRRQLG